MRAAIPFALALLAGPAAAQEVRDAQFSYHFTTFGRLAIPARLELAHSR